MIGEDVMKRYLNGGYIVKVTVKRFGLPYNPQKDKKKKNKIIRHIVWFLIAFIAISVLLTLAVEALIRESVAKLAVNDTIDSAWIGSLASYWGGIIGGMISGMLAFIGVFYTIRYYKESDEQKEKAAIQPFLNVIDHIGVRPHEILIKKIKWD